MDFHLVKIEGKALKKLIEVVSSGIGTLYRPRSIRRDADAQAYAIKVVGKAQAEADAEARLIEVETDDRICRRIAAKEVRRQDNIDSVVEIAAENLKDQEISDNPVDIDWAARFFDIVQDVSREEMKVLWAKILAKEIERPSTFSLRTLEVLRNITAEEAAIFEKVADYILYQGNDYFLLNKNEVLERFDIHYCDLALLTESGILQPGELVSKVYKSGVDKDSHSAFFYGKYVIFMVLPKSSNEVSIPSLIFTKVGRELYSLLEPKESVEYMQELSKDVKKKNPAASLSYSEWISHEGNRVEYKTPVISL